MTRQTSRLHAVALCVVAVPLLSACAAFNDVVVVDVGDQFRLVEGDADDGVLGGARNGFECRFSATTSRASLFATERQIDGTIACSPLPIPQD